ncbi:MAG TPA: uroporphyrinogen-III synthase [Steroidobacteraceae bacterium]|nr:uroporphyrinogen-III synthase [Steroidobacteraceae bacterium]
MTEPRGGQLAGAAVLITRPEGQADGLARAVAAAGGTPVSLPTLSIEPVVPTSAVSQIPDLVIFTSANAVRHGRACVRYDDRTRFAAVGRATAAAMRESGLPEPLVPATASSSEGLLDDPRIAAIGPGRALLVKGVGGRDLLRRALQQRGFTVTVLDVYRRVIPELPKERITGLADAWRRGGVDVVTATSAEALGNLYAMFGDDRDLIDRTPLVTVSPRITEAAERMGHKGTCIVAGGPSDTELVAAIIEWVQSGCADR